jgi:carbon starvation protein
VVIKRGLLKWAWIPAAPLLWDLIVTMTASWQKIFSGDPKVGYWTQHSQYVAAKEAGKTAFQAAKNAGQLDAVIRNTFIQGTLSIVFAVLTIIVFAAGVIVALRAIRGAGSPLSEDEPVPSRLFAPSGLITTKAEREVQKQWDALPNSHARSVGTGPH